MVTLSRSRGPLVALLLLVPFLSIACGRSPVAPADVQPAGQPESVPASGPHLLRLTLSRTGLPDCQGGVCASLTICFGFGDPVTNEVVVPVTVEREGQVATVRSRTAGDTLTMVLHVQGGTEGGTIAGLARPPGAPEVRISGSRPEEAATVIGNVLAATLAGHVEVLFSIGGNGCSNNGHLWRLEPQRQAT